MGEFVTITSTSRYIYVSRADGSLLSRHLFIEDAIEAAVNAGLGEYRIQYPDRKVVVSKVYGTLPASPAPAAPTALTLEEATGGYVSLSWTDDGNGTSWTVYRDGVPVATVSNAYHTDSGVVPSTLYSYQVQASNATGSSALSDALPVTTSANTPPFWSVGDQAGVINQAFSLNLLAACLDADNHSLTFSILSGAVPGLSLIAGVYAGTPTTAGDYAVTFDAFDGYAHTARLINFTISDPDVTAPTVPGNVAAVVAGSSVTLTWDASTDASGVATYRVFRNGQLLEPWLASPYFDNPVAGTYVYSVSAVDASANANESAQGSAPAVIVLPASLDAPINFSATAASATSLLVSWAANPNGSAPTGYELEKSTDQATWSTVSQYTTPNTSVTNTGLTTGTRYYYRVQATAGGLKSSWSQTSGIPQVSPLVQYGGTSYDRVSYATDATNGWRTTDDVVPGWDYSFPQQGSPELSGMWQFSNNVDGWPLNFPGNRLYKINADWAAMEPAEGNYTLTSTFGQLGSLPAEWAGTQIDVRGAVYNFPTDTSQVTAPTWLAGRGIPTYDSGTFQYYDISHSGFYTPFRLLIDEIAAYVPSGGAVTVGAHPRMFGLVMHGISNSEGEESGLGATPANTVNTALHWVAEFGANAKALCWIGEGRSYRDEVEPIVVDGQAGSRGGLLERFLRNSFTPYETDTDLDGVAITGAVTRTGQLAEQYYNSSGVAQSDNFYLTVDETYPPIANIRYYADQMEEFGTSYIGVGAKGWADDLSQWQHIYRMCLLRGLQMRRNSLAVEKKSTALMGSSGYAGATGAVNGAEGFVNPALMKWGSVQLGRRVYSASEDASFEANEAFCLLCRMRARSYNPLTLGQGFGTNAIHNLERWLTQREVDGAATTPTITRNMGYNPSGDDSALVSNPTAATMEMARRGTDIGFRLDDRMRFGSSVAVKVTYYDNNTETVTLRYTNTSGGTTDRSWTNTGTSAPSVRTRTIFISNFSNTSAVNLRLLCSEGTTGFMFVRVIRV